MYAAKDIIYKSYTDNVIADREQEPLLYEGSSNHRLASEPRAGGWFLTMDCCTKRRLLTVMTSVCACAAFGLLCISVATDYWLFTKELIPKDATDSEEGAGNATKGGGRSGVPSSDSGGIGAKETAKYLKVYSGLWRHCTYVWSTRHLAYAPKSNKPFGSHNFKHLGGSVPEIPQPVLQYWQNLGKGGFFPENLRLVHNSVDSCSEIGLRQLFPSSVPRPLSLTSAE
ncbi:hypothetical protein RRG08_010642 [Elysia crispata]|uniref:Uncharacterized protein n=1 Tax=Elysia crispata TaxID=231223 RepID=A0AAE0Z0H7_9GAST|nr:hypothetical protein RRG08_010642 [Elysia crispata]